VKEDNAGGKTGYYAKQGYCQSKNGRALLTETRSQKDRKERIHHSSATCTTGDLKNHRPPVAEIILPEPEVRYDNGPKKIKELKAFNCSRNDGKAWPYMNQVQKRSEREEPLDETDLMPGGAFQVGVLIIHTRRHVNFGEEAPNASAAWILCWDVQDTQRC